MLFQKLFFFLSYFLVLLAFWFMSLDYPSLLPPTCSLTYAMDLLLEAYFYFLLLINFFFHIRHIFMAPTLSGSSEVLVSMISPEQVLFLFLLLCFQLFCHVFILVVVFLVFLLLLFFCCCVYGFDIMFLFQLLQGFMLVPLLWFFCCCVFIVLLLCFYFFAVVFLFQLLQGFLLLCFQFPSCVLSLLWTLNRIIQHLWRR